MNTVTAQDIKRRGISAVDSGLEKGPVHVIKNNRPQYVVMDEETYEDLIAEREESYSSRIRNSLEDLKAGRVRGFSSVRELMEVITETNDRH